MPFNERKNYICHILSESKGIKGFIYKHYCLGGTKNTLYHRLYFSDENGQLCDAIRKTINTWKRKKMINSNEYYFLLASFLESIEQNTNTSSVNGHFLKRLKKSAKERCIIKPLDIIPSDIPQLVLNKDKKNS